MASADQIRNYALRKIVEPARTAGKAGFTIRSGDLHNEIGLRNSLPNVCNVLDGRKFHELAGVKLRRRTGPKASTTVEFEFVFAGTPAGRVCADTSAIDRSLPATPDDEAVHIPRGAIDFADAIALVSCVKSKRAQRTAAKDMYVSPWFEGVRAIVERAGVPWYILSAQHGLLDPETVIEPYERTLNDLGVAERRRWADSVTARLQSKLAGHRRVVMFAGLRYREFLVPWLRARDVDVVVPLEGLRQGEQGQWVSSHRPR